MMQQKRSFPFGTLILSIVALVSVPVMIIRYLYGLGAMSNLSDGRAWGLWISFDLYCGVALAAGGFTLAALVHIFNQEKYHPVVRPAILTAFLGYIIVILALLVDLGQPWYIWHAIIYWNIHSPLFEVAWCVMLYTGVLALEMSPALFERLNWRDPSADHRHDPDPADNRRHCDLHGPSEFPGIHAAAAPLYGRSPVVYTDPARPLLRLGGGRRTGHGDPGVHAQWHGLRTPRKPGCH